MFGNPDGMSSPTEVAPVAGAFNGSGRGTQHQPVFGSPPRQGGRPPAASDAETGDLDFPSQFQAPGSGAATHGSNDMPWMSVGASESAASGAMSDSGQFGGAAGAGGFGHIDWSETSGRMDSGSGAGGGHSSGGGSALPADYDLDDPENEPPLLQELEIDLQHIATKTISVVDPRKGVDASVVTDADLAGPVIICLALATLLLLGGKLHFASVYGFSLVGCLAMYGVLNLLTNGRPITLLCVFSVFGYALLPMALLAAIRVLAHLDGVVGTILALLCVAWSSHTAAKFFEAALNSGHQRLLIAYPTGLLYGVFALITIF